MNEIVLTPHQQGMCDTIIDWYNSIKKKYGSQRYIVCSGYAGTGKTTTLNKIVEYFGKQGLRVGCATYTGKASTVLESKTPKQYTNYCGTIHGLIYKAVIDDDGKLIGFRRKERLDQDIIIIDECSMISDKIFNDLLRYRKPIVFIGDSAQLPPVKADYFNIFQDTAYHLSEIHRQAVESPIILLSMMIRNGDKIDKHYLNKKNIRFENYSSRNIVEEFQPFNDEIILCGMNKTRVGINQRVREYNNLIRIDPYVGEKVINLQNNHELGVMNGNIGLVKKIKNFEKNFAYEMEVDFFGRGFNSKHLVYKKGFNKPKQEDFFKVLKNHKVDIKLSQYEKMDIFDYGYCLSVHKSQGSQWNKVILIAERNPYQTDEDFRKWYYTAVTRAENELVIFE